MGSWSSSVSVRYNQDNQRDFEEKAAAQMIAMLTKRNLLQLNLRSNKSHSSLKHGIWNSNLQPIGKMDFLQFKLKKKKKYIKFVS